MIRGTFNGFPTYTEILENISTQVLDEDFQQARNLVDTHDVVNLQYTSGSTGNPKAAMLTHQYDLVDSQVRILMLIFLTVI